MVSPLSLTRFVRAGQANLQDPAHDLRVSAFCKPLICTQRQDLFIQRVRHRNRHSAHICQCAHLLGYLKSSEPSFCLHYSSEPMNLSRKSSSPIAQK
nr:MAG TPA: hypothetical protein [Caudoviricetes sp.]